MALKPGMDENQLKNFMAKMKRLKRFSEKEFSREIGTVCFATARKARRKISGHIALRQSIYVKKISHKAVQVGAISRIAPYIEFGTGPFVNVEYLLKLGFPRSYAMQFKGKVDGNTIAEPFFFISFDAALAEGVKRINKKLKNFK